MTKLREPNPQLDAIVEEMIRSGEDPREPLRGGGMMKELFGGPRGGRRQGWVGRGARRAPEPCGRGAQLRAQAVQAQDVPLGEEVSLNRWS